MGERNGNGEGGTNTSLAGFGWQGELSMTKPIRKSAAPAQSRMTRSQPPAPRPRTDAALAREALLARAMLAAAPERDSLPERPHWPLLGSMLVH